MTPSELNYTVSSRLDQSVLHDPTPSEPNDFVSCHTDIVYALSGSLDELYQQFSSDQEIGMSPLGHYKNTDTIAITRSVPNRTS